MFFLSLRFHLLLILLLLILLLLLLLYGFLFRLFSVGGVRGTRGPPQVAGSEAINLFICLNDDAKQEARSNKKNNMYTYNFCLNLETKLCADRLAIPDETSSKIRNLVIETGSARFEID